MSLAAPEGYLSFGDLPDWIGNNARSGNSFGLKFAFRPHDLVEPPGEYRSYSVYEPRPWEIDREIALERLWQTINSSLMTGKLISYGITAETGELLPIPASFWRINILIEGNICFPIELAKKEHRISFKQNSKIFKCIPILAKYDLAIAYDAETIPDQPIRNFEKMRQIIKLQPKNQK
jgi:hypothetical protein